MTDKRPVTAEPTPHTAQQHNKMLVTTENTEENISNKRSNCRDGKREWIWVTKENTNAGEREREREREGERDREREGEG